MTTATRVKIRVRVKTKALLRLLGRRAMTQAQLAAVMGVQTATMSRFIHGVHDARGDFRQRLLRVLNVGFDEIFELVQVHSRRG